METITRYDIYDGEAGTFELPLAQFAALGELIMKHGSMTVRRDDQDWTCIIASCLEDEFLITPHGSVRIYWD